MECDKMYVDELFLMRKWNKQQTMSACVCVNSEHYAKLPTHCELCGRKCNEQMDFVRLNYVLERGEGGETNCAGIRMGNANFNMDVNHFWFDITEI